MGTTEEPLLEGIIEVGLDATMTAANAAATRLLAENLVAADGLSVTGFVEGHGAVIGEDGRPIPLDELAVMSCLATGRASGPQLQGIPTPAGLRWIQVVAVPRTDAEGALVGATVHLVDASDLVASIRRLREILRETPAAMVVMRPAEGVVFASDAYGAVFGRDWPDLTDAQRRDRMHPDDLPAAVSARAATMAGELDDSVVQFRVRVDDGSWRWVEQSSHVVRDEAGGVAEVHAVFRETTDLHRAYDALRASEEKYRLLADNSSDMIVRAEPDLTVTYVSPAVRDMLGYEPERMTDLASLVHPDDLARLLQKRAEVTDGAQVRFRVRVRRADGAWRHLEFAASPVVDADGTVTAVQGRGIDVTDRVEAERERARADARWRAAFDHGPVGQALIAPDGRTLEVNAALRRMTGRDFVGPGAGEEARDSVHPEDAARVIEAFAVVSSGSSSSAEVEARIVDTSGREFWGLLSLAPAVTEDGDVDYVIVQLLDVDAMVRQRESLVHDASHDPLTGLVNRAGLQRAIGEALSTCPEGRSVVVCFVDLDGFKEANDRLGHGVGDLLLVEVARRLAGTARRDDLVGRYGGDEFLVLGRGLSGEEGARAMAVRLGGAFAEPLEAAGQPVTMQASIGVAVAGPGTSVTEVVARADAAMYAAKRRGPGNWEVVRL